MTHDLMTISAEYNLRVLKTHFQYNGNYNQSATKLEYKCVNNTFPNRNKGNKPKLRPSKKKLPPQEWPEQSDLGEGGGGTTVQNIWLLQQNTHLMIWGAHITAIEAL